MKIANVKGVVAKLMMVGLAAGALALASPAMAEAQRFAVGVQFGNSDYRSYPNGYRYDRYDPDAYRYSREEIHERRQREERAEFARRQAYLRHAQWEREQREYSRYGDR